MLHVSKLKENAKIPVRGSKGAIGYDLFALEGVVIHPCSRCLVSTGISIAIPPGHYGRIAPRSGLSSKFNIDIGAGVIDPDYRGEIKVLVVNNSARRFSVESGMRIAQLILEKASILDLKLVKELPKTDRGNGGFGSTGV